MDSSHIKSKSMNKLTVDKEFSKRLILIPAEASVSTAAQLMQTHRVRHLPVTEHEKIIGILSDRDVLRAAKTEFYTWGEQLVEDREFDERSPVRNYMSSPVISVDVKTSVADVAQKMIKMRISSLLVTKESAPVGIVTTEDLLGLIVKHFSNDQEEKCSCPKKNRVMSNPIELYFDDKDSMGIYSQRHEIL